MAVCESQLESGLARLNREGSDETSQERTLPAALPLTVDYRSPVSHFVPPAVELYAARHKQEQVSSAESSETATPVKRKRGRPRVDKTSPEYLAGLAARKQAREMAAMSRAATGTSTGTADTPPGTKRKRGRPRVDKTSPEYLARKRQRELEALERKAKREYKRRTTADSGASSSTGDATPRVKRKYTKRTPSVKKNDGTGGTERVKGKRGRPRKVDANNQQLQPQIRVRNNLMPVNNEPISLDSDDEPDLGSPSAASDSLSLDENLRALRHIHEKYANIDKDELYSAHLLAGQYKKPARDTKDDDVLSVRSSEGGASVKELDTRVEKLEDSSNSDSDSSSSGSGSSSSSSSSSSSCSSDSDSSDSETERDRDRHGRTDGPNHTDNNLEHNSTYSAPPWAAPPSPRPPTDSGSESDPERAAGAAGVPLGPPEGSLHDDISESDNESPDKSFQCHICKKWYSTRVTLKIHRRSHQSRGGGTTRSRQRATDRYECDICNEAFPRREKLYAHRAEAHRGSMTFRCEVCRRCFEHDEELSLHHEKHTDDERNGRCSSCGATFPRYEQLRRHRAVAHPAAPQSPPPGATEPGGGTMAHACAHCGKRFTHVHSLTRHLHNHAKQLYRCVVCKASFARADQLAQHLNSHLANYKRLKP